MNFSVILLFHEQSFSIVFFNVFKDYTQDRVYHKVFSCDICWQVCGEATA